MKSKVKVCAALLTVFLLMNVFGCSKNGENAENSNEDIGDYDTVNSETESEDHTPETPIGNAEKEQSGSDKRNEQSAQSADNDRAIENGKENILTVSLSDGKKGEEITGTLSVEGEVNLCAVDLKILFDHTKLRLTKLGSDDADVLINEKTDDGAIKLNYLKIKNVTAPFELCFFTFEVLTEEPCESTVSIEVKDAVKVDGDDILDCPYAVRNGTAGLNGGVKSR